MTVSHLLEPVIAGRVEGNQFEGTVPVARHPLARVAETAVTPVHEAHPELGLAAVEKPLAIRGIVSLQRGAPIIGLPKRGQSLVVLQLFDTDLAELCEYLGLLE